MTDADFGHCKHCGWEGEPKTVDYYGNDVPACRDCEALL